MSDAIDVREPADAFVDKWRMRWPEWALAQVFVPHAQRDTWVAWFALVDELVDAAWAHADPRPGEAKLGWWMQELHGWSTGARRHPLGRALPLGHPAWAMLAGALPPLGATRTLGNAATLQAALEPLARALADVEALLGDGARGGQGADAWMRWLTARRLAASLDAAAFVASSPIPAAWPAEQGGKRAPALWRALLRARAARGDAGRPLPPWRALLVAWRAARNAAVH